MKHYSFEYVKEKDDKTNISLQHNTKPILHNIKLKILCLLLAVVFWLIATDVRIIKENREAKESQTAQTTVAADDGTFTFC